MDAIVTTVQTSISEMVDYVGSIGGELILVTTAILLFLIIRGLLKRGS